MCNIHVIIDVIAVIIEIEISIYAGVSIDTVFVGGMELLLRFR